MKSHKVLGYTEKFVQNLEVLLVEGKIEALKAVDETGTISDYLMQLEHLSKEEEIELDYDLIVDLGKRCYHLLERLQGRYGSVEDTQEEFDTVERIKQNVYFPE